MCVCAKYVKFIISASRKKCIPFPIIAQKYNCKGTSLKRSQSDAWICHFRVLSYTHIDLHKFASFGAVAVDSSSFVRNSHKPIIMNLDERFS